MSYRPRILHAALAAALLIPALAAHAAAQGYGSAAGRAALDGRRGAAPAPLEREKLAYWEPVHFAAGSARLEPGSLPTLDQTAKAIKAGYGNVSRIRVEGYAYQDGVPDEMALSDERARVVRDYLVAAGVPEGKLDIAAGGSASPVANADPALAATLSRRVEFVPVQEPAPDAMR